MNAERIITVFLFISQVPTFLFIDQRITIKGGQILFIVLNTNY